MRKNHKNGLFLYLLKRSDFSNSFGFTIPV